MEWVGFAIAAGSLPAVALAVFTFCNVVPRAFHHYFPMDEDDILNPYRKIGADGTTGLDPNDMPSIESLLGSDGTRTLRALLRNIDCACFRGCL